MKIMLIDYDDDLRDTFKQIFFDLKIDYIKTATQALEILKKTKYDLVLVDHYTCLRENLCEQFKNIKSNVIVLTSSINLEKENQFSYIRPDHFIKKPFSVDDIENLIFNCI